MKVYLLKKIINNFTSENLLLTNLILKNHLLYSEIKHGLLKGIYFNSSAFSANQFEPVAFIQPLYVPSDSIDFTFGINLKTSKNQQWWEYNENELEQISNELAKVINQTQTNCFSKILNASSFYEFYRKDKKNSVRHFEAIAYTSAYGGLNNARVDLEDLLAFIKKKEDLKVEWVKQIYANTLKLLESDPIVILKEWEQNTTKSLKI